MFIIFQPKFSPIEMDFIPFVIIQKLNLILSITGPFEPRSVNRYLIKTCLVLRYSYVKKHV